MAEPQRRRRRKRSVRACSRANKVFLNRSPSRRSNSHTALCETLIPCAARSSLNPCSVGCGPCLIRYRMQARCALSTGSRCPLILPGAADPVARSRCDPFTTEETAPPNRKATARPLPPCDSAATTRSRGSFARGRAIRCWPPPRPASGVTIYLRGTPVRNTQSINRVKDCISSPSYRSSLMSHFKLDRFIGSCSMRRGNNSTPHRNRAEQRA